ncbi:MAG: NAD(P)H-dependent glycerol-3-phosphate dehydrogenase [Synergistaceae bacterium]
MKITILGAGSFGTAIASHLASLKNDVLLWTIDQAQANSINSFSINTFCFKEVKLDNKISATTDLECAFAFSNKVIMAIPSQFVREVLEKIDQAKHRDIHILNLSKGIEIKTGKFLHQIYSEICPDYIYSALSGPSHAEEVMSQCPTTVSVASFLDKEAEMWQSIVTGNSFRAYTSHDVIGLEVGGATKNIYAIASGIAKAMNLGDNAVAALACRGLSEMMRFGIAMGASPITLSGLAGVGDLIVTCCSIHSRNFRLGYALGSGKSLDEATKELGQVAEGVYTAKAIVENSKQFNVEMPLAEGVYRVLFNNASPSDILKELFARPVKSENLL